VDAAALVAFREGRQVLGSFKIKLPFEGDSHPDVLEGIGASGNRGGKQAQVNSSRKRSRIARMRG
jgi:hypothetical protein